MIKRTILLVSAFVVSFSVVKAGNGAGFIDFGVKAGLTTMGSDLNRTYKGSFNMSSDSRVGFHLGIISRINLPMFHLQPELLFTRTSYKLMIMPENNPMDYSRPTVRISSVEFPVVAGLRLLWFRFQAGPMFNLMTETKLKRGGIAESVNLVKPSMSYLLGVGFDIGKLNLDIRYNGQFRRYEQSLVVEGAPSDLISKVKANNWMFSVGYLF